VCLSEMGYMQNVSVVRQPLSIFVSSYYLIIVLVLGLKHDTGCIVSIEYHTWAKPVSVVLVEALVDATSVCFNSFFTFKPS